MQVCRCTRARTLVRECLYHVLARRGAEGLSAVGCMAVPCKCVVCKFKVRRCAESAKILFPFLFWRACVTVVVGNSGQKRGEAVVRNMVKQSLPSNHCHMCVHARAALASARRG